MNNINSQTILSQLYLLLGAEKGNAIKENQLTSYLSTLLWYKYNWGENMILQLKEEKDLERIIEWYQSNRCLPCFKSTTWQKFATICLYSKSG